jgi:Carboxymuconolactone decarboxylase family
MPDTETPVRDTVAAMTLASLENSDLAPRELMIARMAALVALDAPAASYALNIEVAADAGLSMDDIEDVLVAVAPVVGTTRITSAVGSIAEGLGLVIALAEAELEAEAELDAAGGDG